MTVCAPAPAPSMTLATPAQAADLIAACLAGGYLACALFEALLGREVTLRVIGPHVRPATDAEAGALRLGRREDLYVRDGLLLAGTITCARTRLKLHPGRVRDLDRGVAWGRIRGGEPCGAVLAGRLRRACRQVEIPGGDGPVAVTASAVLVAGAVRLGLAAEDVPADLCARLAAG